MNQTVQNAAVVAKPTDKSFPGMIEQLKKQVALALPKHLNPDRMGRIALTEFNKNRALLECDPRTVFASVVIASQMGLEPGIMGQGYLIPYNGACQFVPGWKGLVDLAQRSGRASVWTGAVFEGDEFTYDYGTNPTIHHIPKGEDDPAKITHVYAVGRVRGAEFAVIEVWPIAKVWKHRDRFNKVGKRHYSYAHPEMYARKIPLLQVLKYMPASVELALALDLEHAADTTGQRINLEDAVEGVYTPTPSPEQAEQQQRTETVKEKLAERQGGKAAPPAQDKQAAPAPLTGEAALLDKIASSPNIDVLDERWSVMHDSLGGIVPPAVKAAYDARRVALGGDL